MRWEPSGEGRVGTGDSANSLITCVVIHSSLPKFISWGGVGKEVGGRKGWGGFQLINPKSVVY